MMYDVLFDLFIFLFTFFIGVVYGSYLSLKDKDNE